MCANLVHKRVEYIIDKEKEAEYVTAKKDDREVGSGE